jgi:uncharacterized protein
MEAFEKQAIDQTIVFVKKTLENAESGHDWWHVYRVWNAAKTIAKNENCNLFVVELASLLHDIADQKFHNGNEELASQMSQNFLESIGIDLGKVEQVVKIIQHVSFKGGNYKSSYTSKELEIVQDADSLDAMGAIGIARTFNYGGFRNRTMYDPSVSPKLNMTKEEYQNSTRPTLNHFYEKLLILKDRMHTQTGRKLAEKRHEFMVLYLEQFYKEWEGEG